MKNFSYFWVFFMFLLQVLALGSISSTIGKERKPNTGADLFFMLIYVALTGLALYFWE